MVEEGVAFGLVHGPEHAADLRDLLDELITRWREGPTEAATPRGRLWTPARAGERVDVRMARFVHNPYVPWWTALIGGVFALAGVALGQYFNYQQRRDERKEGRRLEQRDALVELIDAVEHWAPQAEVVSLFMGKAGADDLVEFVNTDSGKALSESTRQLKRVLVRCRLIINDEEIRPLVLRVADDICRLPEEINAPILDALKSGRDPMDSVLASIRYYRDVQRLALLIQERALQRLTSK
jgi:hypothetical protein